MKTVYEMSDAKYLKAECGVRYWEDATVNGVDDVDGTLIPCRDGDAWMPLIDIDTGIIQDWPKGTVADIHYKVCDDSRYYLLASDIQTIAKVDGYVIPMMYPEGNGYGDYVIMKVNGDGKIANWRKTFNGFEE
jgi:hypothetical protein